MDQWNRAIAEIENHLDGHIDVSALARLVLTTEFHFRRIFSTLAGMPISEYIRRRRMTVAAAAILEGREKIDTIARSYGYTSPDSFTRAFKTVHGLTPEQARREGATLLSQPRLTFRLHVEGSSEISYRIVRKDSFKLVGRTARVPIIHHGTNPAMVEFEESISDTDYATIENLSDQEPLGVLAVCDNIAEDRAEGSSMNYGIAAATHRSPPTGHHCTEVAAGTWLVLSSTGVFPQAVAAMWFQAGAQWFPSNPYRLIPGPEIVQASYDPSGSRVRAELWLPVKPTSRLDVA
ncbi:AraC family transcriptional regulator [Phytoactinopolyspora limicola]|uniref:AraC family transcriptional regulator n=1 Tax=Phytoactinopolyspora limicola TaxID=2715536 RepID=UPI00140E76A1|nr:AraC family transcriptional regulator [Phytoactinopolyspora limicola]